MKRLLLLLLALPFLVLAFVLGAANAEPVSLDLLLVRVEWPLGVVLMLALGLGMVLSVLVLYLARVLPLQYQLRNCQRKLEQAGGSHEIQPL